jgi:hypothetical protein
LLAKALFYIMVLMANAFIYHFNTQTMHIKSRKHDSIATYAFPKKLTGIEPGSSVR